MQFSFVITQQIYDKLAENVKGVFINYDIFDTFMIFKLWSPGSLSCLGEGLKKIKSIEDYAHMRNQVSRWLRADVKLAVEFLYNLNYHETVNRTLKLMSKLLFQYIIRQDFSQAQQLLSDIVVVLQGDPLHSDSQYLSQIIRIEESIKNSEGSK